VKRLSSKENPLVKKLLKFKERPERFIPKPDRPEAELLVEGPKVIETALRAGVRFSSVAVTEEFASSEKWSGLLDRLLQKETPVVVLDRRLIKQLSETVTPQGIIGIARYRTHSLEELSDERVLVVGDGIQDPGNAGSLLRCADGAGLEAVVVLKNSANPYHPKVIRASAGSIFHLKVALVQRHEFLRFVTDKGFNLVYTSQDAREELFSWHPAPPMAVVFGSEAHGVSEEIKKAANQAIRVPIYGRAESLNVTAAAAVVLYHIVRGIR
jgi:TrmH family RNA methyltransferase